MALQYFYIGTLWTVVYLSPQMLHVAEQLDNLVGLDSPEIRQVIEKFMDLNDFNFMMFFNLYLFSLQKLE